MWQVHNAAGAGQMSLFVRETPSMRRVKNVAQSGVRYNQKRLVFLRCPLAVPALDR